MNLIFNLFCQLTAIVFLLLLFVCFLYCNQMMTLILILFLQVAAIRQYLSNIYEREQSWREAANVLVGIPLETGQK